MQSGCHTDHIGTRKKNDYGSEKPAAATFLQSETPKRQQDNPRESRRTAGTVQRYDAGFGRRRWFSAPRRLGEDSFEGLQRGMDNNGDRLGQGRDFRLNTKPAFVTATIRAACR